MAAVIYLLVKHVDWIVSPFKVRLLWLCVIISLGATVYVVLCMAFRVRELVYVKDKLSAKISSKLRRG